MTEDHGKSKQKARAQKTFLEGLMATAVEGIFRDLKANDPSFAYEDLAVQGVDVNFTVTEKAEPEIVEEVVEEIVEAPEEAEDPVLEEPEEPAPEAEVEEAEPEVSERDAKIAALEAAIKELKGD